ncbi:MAG TPA: hypothetical protein VJO14_05975, partial [Bacteroidota bacterium]|nr:hypothetical protein [Bacteroidota bacterium]
MTVACIRNPFDPLVSREIRHFEPGKSVRELAMEFYPSGSEEYDLEVALDGVRILDESKFDLIPKEGVSVAFCAVPKDGGDGKNPLALIASLALVIAAPYAAGALAGAYIGAAGVGYSSLLAGAAYLAGMGGTLIVGGLLINAVFPPSIPDAPNMGSYENSPTYSWDSGGNPLVEGTILPELLGKVRITPPVIGKYVETLGDKQYLNLLYAIAGHRIGSLYGLRVSGVDTTDSGNILTTQHAMTGNFNDVSVEGREGKVNQTVIQAFADTREDVAVGSKLNETTWTTRTTNGNGVQGFGVTIGLPKGLFYANDSGGLNAQTVKVYIEYSVHGQNNWIPAEVYSREDYTISTSRWSAGYYGEWVPGNGWVELEAGSSNPADHVEGERYADAIWDADTQVRPLAYWRWVVGEQIVQRGTLVTGYVTITAGQSKPIHRVFYKDNLSPGQYDIRCKLVDALPTGARYGNDVYFESFQEIVYDDFTYPGMGLLAVRALATDQLSGSIPKIDVIATRSTVPVWTGSTYEDKPADNPAWGCYHLLHRAWRDDGGTVHVEGVAKERIVYSAFESWASWCATQGYTCNIYFDSGFSVRRALDIVGLNGRGVVVQLGSKFSCIVDRPDTAVQRFLFTMGNIEKITFQEEWLPMEDRANAIEVTYFDNNLGRQTVELYAYDFDTTDREINKAQQTLYGCTDRDLAIKYGTFRLNCNRYLTLTGSWGADVDAIACVQGDVVEAAHDVPRFGVSGRVVSSAASSITLDRPVTIEGGKTYYVTVKHQDDDTRETKTVTNGAGTYTTLNISGSWAKNPALHAIYSFGETGLVTKAMRVVHIARAQDLRKKLICQEYISEVYTDGATIPLPPVPPALPIVRNLKAMEIYTGGKATGVTLSWEGRVETVWIYQRQTGMSWQLIGTTSGASYQISNLGAGQEYQFAVCNSANPADGQTVTITLSGRDVLPAIADPVFDDARCTYTDKIQLVWLPIADELLGFFELRTDLDWGNPTNMVYQGKATSFTMKPTQSSYTFYLKSHDTFLNYSSGYDSITLTHTVPVPVFVSIDGSTFGRVRIEWEPINDESYDVVEVWRSLTNDRDTATLKGAIHSNVFVDASVTVSTTYYYWFRTKSIFGTYSAWESGQTAGHSVATAQITTAEIADNAISQIKLATSIVPPEVVDSLPTLPDDAYPEGKIVYLASDGKLYRNDQVGGGGVNATDNFNRSSLGANWTQQPVDSGTVVTTGSAY